MGKTTVREPDGGNFAPAPEGLHQAVCCDVWEIWTAQRPEVFGGGLQDRTRLVWQLDAINEETGKPFEVSQEYTASLHEKSKLRQHLEAWRGRKFTAEELKGFDLETVIGSNCQIQVVRNLGKNGKTYANVQAIVPVGKGMTKIRVTEDYVRHKDRKKRPENGGVPEDFSPSDDDVPF